MSSDSKYYKSVQEALDKYREQLSEINDYKNQLLEEIKEVFYSTEDIYTVDPPPDETNQYSIDELVDMNKKNNSYYDEEVDVKMKRVIDDVTVDDLKRTEFSYQNGIHLSKLYREKLHEKQKLENSISTFEGNIENVDIYNLYTLFLIWIIIAMIILASTITFLLISDKDMNLSMRLITFLLTHLILLYVIKNVVLSYIDTK